jgi:L-fuculose-phosphate aldolase
VGIEYPGERAARLAMVEVGRRLYARQLISGGEGNLSCRLGPRRLLCTPAGVNKGFLAEDQLVVTDLSGKPLHETARPSSELLLHLACYEGRDDCLAVVHAHPPHAVALTLAEDELIACMPEAITALGEVPTARYATPGTERVAEAVRPFLERAHCVLMERHGALAMGFGQAPLHDACDKMEMLEGLQAQREANLKALDELPRPRERDR